VGEEEGNLRVALRIALQALVVVLAAAGVAIASNAARTDGIALVAAVEYDIFAPCADSEAKTQAASAGDLGAGGAAILYVDARPAEAFAAEHAAGAVSAPYSVLFGAAPEAIASVRSEAAARKAKEIVVYGEIAEAARDGGVSGVDVAKPLAEQLVESGLPGAKHFAGGLAALKKSGVRVVQGTGGAR
jgi:rhodanese-related sulfurtransferase